MPKVTNKRTRYKNGDVLSVHKRGVAKITRTDGTVLETTEDRRNFVAMLAACGIERQVIADRVGVTIRDFNRLYGRAYEDGIIDATYKVGNVLFEKAMNGDTTSCIFWLKARAKWIDNHSKTEITGRKRWSFEYQGVMGKK